MPPRRFQKRRQIAVQSRSYRSAARSRVRRYRLTTRRSHKPIAFQEHSFVERSTQTLNLDVNGGTTGLSFKLDNIYNRASYADIFGQYKINKIIVNIRYKMNGQVAYDNVTSSMNEINPLLYYKVDLNDDTADSLETLKASARTQTQQITNNKPEVTIVLVPAVLEEIYKSAIASTYAPKTGQWLTTDDLSVPHFGLKLNLVGPSGSPLNPGSCSIEVKYYFSMKNNE